jgi:hypothetical protein
MRVYISCKCWEPDEGGSLSHIPHYHLTVGVSVNANANAEALTLTPAVGTGKRFCAGRRLRLPRLRYRQRESIIQIQQFRLQRRHQSLPF